MCCTFGTGGSGAGSGCESPFTWMAPWLDDPEVRQEILCIMLGYQIDCIDRQLGNTYDMSQREIENLEHLRDHVGQVRDTLGC